MQLDLDLDLEMNYMNKMNCFVSSMGMDPG